MQQRFSTVITFVVFVHGSSVAARDKHCSDIPPMRHFSAAKFSGLWYDLVKTADPYSDTLQCVTTQYETLGSAGLHIIKNALDSSNNTLSLEADAIFIDPSKCNGATVITEDDREGVYYTVVTTNYKDYAVVVACTLDNAPYDQ
ncbi:hypothetical protein MRX96_027148 [Rhipicephalus microplus]